MAQQILALLAAFGFGSVISVTVQAWLSQRAEVHTRIFQEKREAYIGLLEAYRKVAEHSTKQASLDFAYWKIRCGLVADQTVMESIDRLESSPPNSDKRGIALSAIETAMRKDLGVGI